MAGGPGTARRRGAARRTAAWGAVLGAGVLLVLAGCTSGGGGDSGGSGDPAGGVSAPQQAQEQVGAAARDAGTGPDPAAGTDQSGGGTGTDNAAALRIEAPALIRTAELTVRVEDVAARARQAQDYARAAGGAVTGDNRSGSGDRATADLVLKVQPGRLDGVLDQLSGLGEEQRRASSTEDVTEQVADVRSRVATMEASIARVRAILSRSTRIGDVVAVEGELSRRVTELESLQARQRALAGRVGLATVTLHLIARQAPATAPAEDRTGFLGGLQDGWRAFTDTVGWLLTVLGAVLPFLLIVVPVLLAVRWYVARNRPAPAPAPAAPVS